MGSGEEMGRMSFDFCSKRQSPLPTAVFRFNDLCCSPFSYFNKEAFIYLEEIAKVCDDYQEIRKQKEW
jgi:hypothetical protein